MWVNHHLLFDNFARVDRPMLLLNILLLMLIAFVPFPTRIAAEFARSGVDRRNAALLYGITMTTTAILFFALWMYGSRRLLRADADPRRRERHHSQLFAWGAALRERHAPRLRQFDRQPDHVRRDRALLRALRRVIRAYGLDRRTHGLLGRPVLVSRRAEQHHHPGRWCLPPYLLCRVPWPDAAAENRDGSARLRGHADTRRSVRARPRACRRRCR